MNFQSLIKIFFIQHDLFLPNVSHPNVIKVISVFSRFRSSSMMIMHESLKKIFVIIFSFAEI